MVLRPVIACYGLLRPVILLPPVNKCLNLVAVREQEVDVVVGIHQAILLVTVEFKLLATSRGVVRNPLVGHVNGQHCLGIFSNGGKDFLEKIFTHHDGEHEVIEFVLLMYIRKETAYDNSETISRNRPRSMLTTRTTTEVLARHQDFTAIRRVVEHKITLCAVGVIAPVAEKIFPKTLLIRCLQKAGGDDLVGVHIFQRKWHTGAMDNVKLLFHSITI